MIDLFRITQHKKQTVGMAKLLNLKESILIPFLVILLIDFSDYFEDIIVYGRPTKSLHSRQATNLWEFFTRKTKTRFGSIIDQHDLLKEEAEGSSVE